MATFALLLHLLYCICSQKIYEAISFIFILFIHHNCYYYSIYFHSSNFFKFFFGGGVTLPSLTKWSLMPFGLTSLAKGLTAGFFFILSNSKCFKRSSTWKKASHGLHCRLYNYGNHLLFGQLNVEEVTNSMYCRLLVNFHILKSEKQCNSTFCPYYVKTFLELSLLQWVPELDSIAVSVFVVILVDFGKYQNQIQIIIWWWDQQACTTWVLELPRPFQSFSGVPSTSHCRRGQAWTFWQRRWSLRWSREGWCWHCGGSRRRRSPSRSSSPG